MSLQQQHTVRGSGPMKDEVLTEGDSSILRYIKTLTSHQTNAKQQRMDRYMQKTKRNSIKNVMPTGLSHQNVLKPKENISKGNIPKQNAKLDNSKSIAPNALKEHEKETGSRKRLQSYQFRDKKRKKTKREKQVPTINSFDRFRFSKTSSPSNTPQYPAASSGNKSTQPQRSKRESIGLSSVQQATNSLMSFSIPTQATAHDPWSASNQLEYQPPEGTSSETLQYAISQQEVAVPAYDHLVHIMESIFF